MILKQIQVDRRSDYWAWSDGNGRTKVLFTGRGPQASREEVLRATNGHEVGRIEVSQLRQIHSNSVVEASPGNAGNGDALVTSKPLLALSIATADCVPVLFSSGKFSAAAHAGWRGIADGIVQKVAYLAVTHSADAIAWIGPSIGPCCYEVSSEVASKVLSDHSQGSVSDSPDRPYLNLAQVVTGQLIGAGIQDIRQASSCTKCNPEKLWSYRGEAQKPGGQNLAFIWRTP
jgi:YfiH family protein